MKAEMKNLRYESTGKVGAVLTIYCKGYFFASSIPIF